MNWTHPKLRPVTFEETEPPPDVFTNAEILDKFLSVPDEEWPHTLLDHPSLAAVIREEIERVRRERLAVIGVLREAVEALAAEEVSNA